MNRLVGWLFMAAIYMSVVMTGVGTYAFLNTITRPDVITVAIELPKRKGIVTMWDPVDPDVGLGGPPSWYVDHNAVVSDEESRYVYRSEGGYTADDQFCMAQNIYFEARNESLRGKIAVALVTMKRVSDPRWENTVCGAVYENKQFSWYSDGLSDRPKNLAKFEESMMIAGAVLSGDTALEDFTYGSTHYHADYVEPYWADDMIRLVKVDTHIFYEEPIETRMVANVL